MILSTIVCYSYLLILAVRTTLHDLTKLRTIVGDYQIVILRCVESNLSYHIKEKKIYSKIFVISIMAKRIVIFGATGNTGLCVLNHAVEKGNLYNQKYH